MEWWLGEVRTFLARVRAYLLGVPVVQPITDDMLLDKRGRPLHGAARASRLRALERERARLLAQAPARKLRIPTLPARRLGDPSLRAARLIAITTVMTFVLATVIGTSGYLARGGGVALGASTTLTVISGSVEVSPAPGEPFAAAGDGTLLRAGMTVRTGADTYAVLTYFEGSTVSLEPGTTLVIDTLGANPDGSNVITMQQVLGKTWHSVTHLANPSSRYELRTPTAVATVRGTKFEVDVDANESGELVSTVATSEGAVATSKAPTPEEPNPPSVLVTPGLQVNVTTSAPLPAPVPQPEPDRVVNVTVDAAQGLVIDPVGRANGIKDGKVVVQTPGAAVDVVDGKVVVTFTKVQDGKIAAVVDNKGSRVPVAVHAVVKERGQAETRAADVTVRAPETTPSPAPGAGEPPANGAGPQPQPAGAAVAALEVRTGEGVGVALISDAQRAEIADSVKVAVVPAAPTDRGNAAAFVPDVPLPSLPVAAEDGSRTPAQARGPQSDARPSERPAPATHPTAKPDGGSATVPKLTLPALPRVTPTDQPVRAEVPQPFQRGDASDQGRQSPPAQSTDSGANADRTQAPQQQGPQTPAPQLPAPRQTSPAQSPSGQQGGGNDDRDRAPSPATPAPQTPAPATPDPTSPDGRDRGASPSGGSSGGGGRGGGGFVPHVTLPTVPLLSDQSKGSGRP